MIRKCSATIISVVFALGLCCVVGSVSCRNSRVAQAEDVIPAQPDYADSTQWYITQRDAPVDLFYIISTETGDYTIEGIPCHYADTRNDSIRTLLYGEMVGVAITLYSLSDALRKSGGRLWRCRRLPARRGAEGRCRLRVFRRRATEHAFALSQPLHD